MIQVVEFKISLVASPGLCYMWECVLNSFIPCLHCMCFISVLLSRIFNVLSSSAITITLVFAIFRCTCAHTHLHAHTLIY